MPQYILLANVRRGSQAQSTPEELQQMTREYMAWVGSLIQQGKYTGGQKAVDKYKARAVRRALRSPRLLSLAAC